MRTIMHVDLDAFYSAIEQRDRPELRGKPVIVGGDPAQRGVVMTASYEARRYGVRSAMPTVTALRLCPRAILVPPRFAVYRQVSAQLHELFHALTPLVEPIALDEAFLDISAAVASPEDAAPTARALKEQVRIQTGLTASIGIGSNKLVAKVASDREKPDGLTVVPAGGERGFLAPLPVRSLFGVGPRAEARLAAAGIERVEQLAEARLEWVVAQFGQGGLEWQRLAQGIDDRLVSPDRPLKQISRETTFPRDVAERDALLATLHTLVDDLRPALAESPPARTVTVKLRFADFSVITRRRTLDTIITGDGLGPAAERLFEESWDGRALRLLGLALSNFVTRPEGQLALFDSEVIGG